MSSAGQKISVLKKSFTRLTFLSLTAGAVVFLLVCLFFFNYYDPVKYDQGQIALAKVYLSNNLVASSSSLTIPDVVVTHIPTPDKVRAIYMSSWIAASKTAREKMLKKYEGTEINTLVMDVKDYSGKIVVNIDSPTLGKYHSVEGRVPDIKEFIDYLHKKNYYVIGKISVFQDDYLTQLRPDLALKNKDDKTTWRDDKGVAWLDVSSQEVWDYAITVSKEAYAVGFDELNFDYIRFPSDGKISNISFPYYEPDKESRSDALKDFYVYIHSHAQEIGVTTSANLFGMVTTNQDDLGIGQILEKAAPYFDYISPMIYPSHYPSGFLQYKNPATKPYEVISFSLNKAKERLKVLGLPATKIRPWLQDFNLGANYNAEMVRAEKRAVYDAGMNSWMMWGSANSYTLAAYNLVSP